MLRHVRSVATRAAKSTGKGPPGRDAPLTAAEKRLTALLRPVAPPPPKTDEEKKRLRARMIRYGKLKRRHHLEVEAKLRRFEWAKWAAIDALPHARRVEAMQKAPDMPMNIPLWTDTPPIKGFSRGDLSKQS